MLCNQSLTKSEIQPGTFVEAKRKEKLLLKIHQPDTFAKELFCKTLSCGLIVET